MKPEEALKEILRENRRMKKILEELQPHIGWQAVSQCARERNRRLINEIEEILS